MSKCIKNHWFDEECSKNVRFAYKEIIKFLGESKWSEIESISWGCLQTAKYKEDIIWNDFWRREGLFLVRIKYFVLVNLEEIWSSFSLILTKNSLKVK
jgi:hypothetical protein